MEVVKLLTLGPFFPTALPQADFFNTSCGRLQYL